VSEFRRRSFNHRPAALSREREAEDDIDEAGVKWGKRGPGGSSEGPEKDWNSKFSTDAQGPRPTALGRLRNILRATSESHLSPAFHFLFSLFSLSLFFQLIHNKSFF